MLKKHFSFFLIFYTALQVKSIQHNHVFYDKAENKSVFINSPVRRDNKCSPKPELLNCGSHPRDMPRMSPYKSAMILSNLELGSGCWDFESVSMKWEVWLVTNDEKHNESVKTLEFFDKQNYFVEQGSLYYGVYKVKLQYNVIFANKILSASASCYFEMVHLPIQTVISGGSKRYQYFKSPINFEIFTLVIPGVCDSNQGTGKIPPLTVIYEWQCDSRDKVCNPLKTIKPFRQINGPFVQFKEYNFTLKVQTVTKHFGYIKEQSQQTEFQTIKMDATSELEVSIECLMNCGGSVFKSNPQEIIHLEAKLGGNFQEHIKSIVYHWNYTIVGSTNNAEDIAEITEKGLPQNLLVIKKNKLIENQKYIFTVSLGHSSYSEIVVETCTLPKSPNCTISPNSGIRGETNFTISCSVPKQKEDFLTTTFEFFDRYTNEETLGRYLGLSTTGILKTVFLTREGVFVRAINVFGAYFEKVIDINLSPSTRNILYSSLINYNYNYNLHNYIYRIGLITACGDYYLSDQTFPPKLPIILLNLLAIEEVDIKEITGATLLINALHNVFFRPNALEKIQYLESETTLKIAKVLNRVSNIMKDTVKYKFKSSPFVTTTRMLEITVYIIDCSSALLGSNSTNNYDLLDYDIHFNVENISVLIMMSLYNILITLAFKVLNSTEKINLHSKNIEVMLLHIRPDVKNISPSSGMFKIFVNFSETFFKTFPQFYMQIIVFRIVPFWWESRAGGEINTHIIDIDHKNGEDFITYSEVYRIDLDVVVDFEPLIIYGSVKQPNPKDNPDINDFVVAVHRIAPSVNSKSFVKFIGIEGNTTLRGLILQDQRPDYDYMNLNSTILTNKSSSLSLTMTESNNNMFLYLGILPGEGVKLGETINYTFILYTASCKVRMYESWMVGPECQVTDETNQNQISCSCSVFSVILGGQIYVAPLDFNPFSDTRLLTTASDYPLAIVLVVIVLISYVFLRLWTDRQDKRNKMKEKVIILKDNSARDTCCYLVGVFTGSRLGAGTTSKVRIMLLGKENISSSYILKSELRSTLQANCDDWFLLYTRYHLGSLTNIVIWIDYSGCRPNWYCSKIFVCDLQKYETNIFYVETWFGISVQEINLKIVKDRATCKEINTFTRVFLENLEYGFREIHLWLSLIIRHPRSMVNNSQRLTVAFSSLFITIGISAFIYFLTTAQSEDLAYFRISYETFFYGTFSGMVGSLFACFTLHLIKASYKLVPSPMSYHEHLDSANLYQLDRQRSIQVEDPSWLKRIKKTISYANPCVVIPVQRNEDNFVGIKINRRKIIFTTLLCIVAAFVNIHLAITCGIHLGEVYSLLWLVSIVIGMIQTTFFTLPVRILVTSLVFVLLKMRYFPLISHVIGETQTMGGIFKSNTYKISEQLARRKSLFRSHNSLHNFREIELIRKQNRITLLWTLMYVFGCSFFLAIVYWLILEFNLNEFCIINNAICREIDTQESCKISFYKRLQNYHEFLFIIAEDIIPVLESRVWYNGEEKTLRTESFPSSGWLGNQGSRLIGPPRLRQIRVKNVDNCHTPKLMIDNSTHCFVRLSAETEDKDNYNTGWDVSDWIDCQFDEASWHFSDAKQAKGALIRTPSGYVCHGGGYILSLTGSEDDDRLAIRNAIWTKWIDIYTRVLILEFTVYNANKDIFTSFSHFAEATPYGTIVMNQSVKSINLSRLPLSGIVFIASFFLILLRVLTFMNIMGIRNFFKNKWNVYETIIIVAYFVSIIHYGHTLIEKKKHEKDLQMQGKDEYFQIQILTSDISSMKNTISILFCLVAFRMLRIIQFNADVRQYLHGLYSAIQAIVWICVVLSLFIFVQWRLVMFLVIPPPGDSFTDLLIFKYDFKRIIYHYQDLHGKILAFLISLLTQIGMFSFVCSLTHYHKTSHKKKPSSSSWYK